MRIIKCNLCGKEISIDDQMDMTSVYHTLGYSSKYDGEYLTLDICPQCLDEIIDNCVIDPILREEK